MMYSLGMNFINLFSTTSTFLPGAIPVRFDTLKICVSTAIAAIPNAVFKTTFAVLRPTPAKACKASRSRGTTPACCSHKMRQVSITFFALLR